MTQGGAFPNVSKFQRYDTSRTPGSTTEEGPEYLPSGSSFSGSLPTFFSHIPSVPNHSTRNSFGHQGAWSSCTKISLLYAVPPKRPKAHPRRSQMGDPAIRSDHCGAQMACYKLFLPILIPDEIYNCHLRSCRSRGAIGWIIQHAYLICAMKLLPQIGISSTP